MSKILNTWLNRITGHYKKILSYLSNQSGNKIFMKYKYEVTILQDKQKYWTLLPYNLFLLNNGGHGKYNIKHRNYSDTEFFFPG